MNPEQVEASRKEDASRGSTHASARKSISRPPGWLILATGALAITCLVLAIAETNLWAHYLIDRGEFLSLFGLGFIGFSGVYLFSRQRLFVSLPLAIPWLLYPIITQGDEIIDNLSINQMRVVCQVLLAAIFATPVVVIVLAARHALAPRPERNPPTFPWLCRVPGVHALASGKIRQGAGQLAAFLFLLEIGIALKFLGSLMVLTLLLMMAGALAYSRWPAGRSGGTGIRTQNKETAALAGLLACIAGSAGIYFGFHHRPGAYQGSPSAFMDPAQKHAFYPLDRVALSTKPPSTPADPKAVEQALTSYGRTLEMLLSGYHILDRNYTYDFHNHLFLKHTPLLANYKSAGLERIQNARKLAKEADAVAVGALATLPQDDPLTALLEDVKGYVAFNLNRALTLENMSAEFERTPAGLQHAAHLYEGEGKALGSKLRQLLTKHRGVTGSPKIKGAADKLCLISQSIYMEYARHVVGF
ncbi:MAG TPA: hypothetical protein VKY92_03065 [Verrucomicrobiae bacterium]|nr:hypothetical protein [Verrucomicrobiae bacterium]